MEQEQEQEQEQGQEQGQGQGQGHVEVVEVDNDEDGGIENMEGIDEIQARTRLSPACSLMLEEIFRSLDNTGRGVLTEKEFKYWGLCWTGTTMGAHSVRWMMRCPAGGLYRNYT